MNILLINGSPKGTGSNTYRLSKAFIDGIGDVSQTECTEVIVKDMDIKSCLGCFGCWKNGKGICVVKDEMQDVLDRMMWADVTIWSFGLYFFNVPGKMKMLIDRQLPLSLPFMDSDSESGGHPSRYDMSGKRHVVISTCGFYTAQGNYESVNAMFDHFLGKGNYETIYCPEGELFRVPELHQKTDEYLDVVRKAGAEFIQSGITAGTREKLDTPLFPRDVFEKMADASWGIDQTADVENSTAVKSDPAFSFTRQMAALYNKDSHDGKDRVLEMSYTDEGKRYQIVMKKDGYEVLQDNFRPYTTKIETSLTVWRDIAAGKISGSEAMAKRMYRVEGDFDLMLHWNRYFGDGEEPAASAESSGTNQKGTTMLLMLLPWIALWVGVSIDSKIGSFVTIGICGLLQLLFARNRRTVYDGISSAAAIGFSLAALLLPENVSPLMPETFSLTLPDTVRLLLPVSYLAFGLMWCVSCLCRIPLTAWYSMNDYNGESAMNNPLFVRTNRILTMAWGVLYVLTSVWTFFLMGSEISSYIAIINNIVPIAMGIFTKWFQGWYPAHYASK